MGGDPPTVPAPTPTPTPSPVDTAKKDDDDNPDFTDVLDELVRLMPKAKGKIQRPKSSTDTPWPKGHPASAKTKPRRL